MVLEGAVARVAAERRTEHDIRLMRLLWQKFGDVSGSGRDGGGEPAVPPGGLESEPQRVAAGPAGTAEPAPRALPGDNAERAGPAGRRHTGSTSSWSMPSRSGTVTPRTRSPWRTSPTLATSGSSFSPTRSRKADSWCPPGVADRWRSALCAIGYCCFPRGGTVAADLYRAVAGLAASELVELSAGRAPADPAGLPARRVRDGADPRRPRTQPRDDAGDRPASEPARHRPGGRHRGVRRRRGRLGRLYSAGARWLHDPRAALQPAARGTAGEQLVADATPVHLGRRTLVFEVDVYRPDDPAQRIARFGCTPAGSRSPHRRPAPGTA